MHSKSYWFDRIWEDLRLFDRKILYGIGKHLREQPESKHSYTIQLVEFGLDLLNPSDITERLQALKKKTVTMAIDGNPAQVPLVTDVRYDDHLKTVTLTFNSLLKEGYQALGERLVFPNKKRENKLSI